MSAAKRRVPDRETITTERVGLGVGIATKRPRVEVEEDIPDTVTLRVARLVYLMTLGRWMTTRQIAEYTGLSTRGARRLMERMAGSQHVPITSIYVGPGRTQKWGVLRVESADFPW